VSQLIHFEEREIKPYAEAVSATELKIGEVYFFVNYVDHLLTPTMETVVFIGRNLEEGDVGILYFQDVRSYRQGVSYEWTTEGNSKATIYAALESQTAHIFEYEQALDGLLGCWLRRRKEGQSK
jgi:hypothetical protein